MDTPDGPWAAYGRAQEYARRAWSRDDRDLSPEAILDRAVDLAAAGLVPDAAELARAGRSAARRERARTALRARHAGAYEDDLRYRGGQDPECAAMVRDALARIDGRDAALLALDASGHGGAEVARAGGIGADAARQRLARARGRLAAVAAGT